MGQNQLRHHNNNAKNQHTTTALHIMSFPAHLARLLLKVDLPAVRVEAVAERVERQDQVETRTDKCLK